jgi:hypothetical protein
MELMPNHIHLLEANRVSFWAKDYFDRWIRNRNECEKVIRYVERITGHATLVALTGTRNPVKAGLCKSPEDWEVLD